MVDLPNRVAISTLLNDARTVRNTKTDKNTDKSRTRNTTILKRMGNQRYGDTGMTGREHASCSKCLSTSVAAAYWTRVR